VTREQRILHLARQFPVLELCDAPLDSWDLPRLISWATGPHPSSGALHAVRFVLSVWDPGAAAWDPGTRAWGGRFDVHEALKSWDLANRKPFQDWVKNPWWP
jgi:hypothetical protein